MTLFNEFELKSELLQAIEELGYQEPTPIQERTIPTILNSQNDLIALAQTGTGKTAGFGLPVLEQISTSDKTTQSIILSPTRELAMQICQDLKNFSKHLPSVKILAVYGGTSIEPQIKALKKGVHIVVGTPGRTLDLIKRKSLNITNIKWLVLDEADEMLNMGFREELDAIIENTPETKQTLLFSATMPEGVRHIANDYLHSPEEISIGKKNTGAKNVEHHCYTVKNSDKYIALKRLADFNPNIYGIIFCRTRRETKEVASQLIDDGYNADALHGDLSQAQRDYVMQRFRAGQLQLLVATDVAARGLDIDELTHIINYNLPDDPEVYIHRSGRTGRAGRKGISVIISHPRESRKIKTIEKLIHKEIIAKKIPTGEEICEKRLYNLMDKMENIIVDEAKIAPYLPAIMKKLEWLDREELLKRFVYVEFNTFLEYYKNAKDINVSSSGSQTRKTNLKVSRGRSRTNKFSRLYINIGSTHNLKASNLLGLINEFTDSNDIPVRRIDIQRNFSFFEVGQEFEELVIESFEDKKRGSEKLLVQVANPLANKTNRGKTSRGKNDKKNFSKRRNSGSHKRRRNKR